jgi:hypothetical protein
VRQAVKTGTNVCNFGKFGVPMLALHSIKRAR